MTESEQHSEIGKAFVERRHVLKRIDCLTHRLRDFGKAAVVLIDNPLHEDSIRTVENASDPREDWKSLQASLIRLDELNKILS